MSSFKVVKLLVKKIKQKDPLIFLLVFLHVAANTVFILYTLYLTRQVTELVISNASFKELTKYIVSFAIINVIACLVKETTHAMTSIRLTTIRIGFYNDLNRKINQVEYSNLENPQFIGMLQYFSDSCLDGMWGIEFLYANIFKVFSALVITIIVIILIMILNPLLILPIGISFAFAFFLSRIYYRIEYRMRANLSQKYRKVSHFSSSLSSFENGKDIRLFDLSALLEQKYSVEIINYSRFLKKIATKKYQFKIGESLILLLQDAAIYLYFVYMALNKMSLSDYVFYLGLALFLSTNLKDIVSTISQSLCETRATADYFAFINRPLVADRGSKVNIGSERVTIAFKHVYFKYPNTEEYILKDFSFSFSSGEKIAIVGTNGCGKTTIVKLLCRLFEVSEGEITLNGKNIKEFNLSSYQKMISVIFQDYPVLAISLLENITLSPINNIPVVKKVEEILKIVGLDAKVKSLPQGIYTPMSRIIDEKGVELSGGEKQKIAIARALYENRPVLIFDEPTSALDALAEQEIYQNLGTLAHGRPTIFISHRLASTRFCDKIILIDKGKIIEQGTHEALMKHQGIYYRMFHTQGKYYKEGEVI